MERRSSAAHTEPYLSFQRSICRVDGLIEFSGGKMYGPSVSNSTIDAAPPKVGVQTVDLRSDTVTRPTPAMRRAMAEAEVGDDVYAEDPTVNRLQARAAEIFGREAALFFPSGSMANLTAIKTWARPGMEVICEAQAHIYLYEMGGVAAIAGCMPNTIEAPAGMLTWELIEPVIRPHAYYRSQTALIELENTQ